MKNEKAKEDMDKAVFQLGRKKARCTEAINLLQMLGLSKHPVIVEAIEVIKQERKRLDKISLFN